MSYRIELRHSSTAGVQPVATSLSLGEAAVNLADGKLYFRGGSGLDDDPLLTFSADGTAVGISTITGDVSASGVGTVTASLIAVGSVGTYSVVVTDAKGRVVSGRTLGSADVTTALGFAPISGNQTITVSGPTLVTATGTTSLSITAATTGVAAGSYTYPSITVDTYGRVTHIASTPAGVTQVIAGSGLSGGTITTSGTISLAASGAAQGTYTYPTVSVDSYGRVTSITSNTVVTAASLSVTSSAIAPTPASTDNSTHVATTAYVRAQGYLTANQTITLSGPTISTSNGSTALTITPVSLAGVAGTFSYPTITLDAYGRVLAATSNTVSPSGVTAVTAGSGLAGGIITTSGTISLSASGVAQGTYSYPTVSVDSYGRVTSISSNAGGGGSAGTISLSGVVIGSGTSSITTTANLAQSDVVSGLGYTPLNKAGDTATSLTLAGALTGSLSLCSISVTDAYFGMNEIGAVLGTLGLVTQTASAAAASTATLSLTSTSGLTAGMSVVGLGNQFADGGYIASVGTGYVVLSSTLGTTGVSSGGAVNFASAVEFGRQQLPVVGNTMRLRTYGYRQAGGSTGFGSVSVRQQMRIDSNDNIFIEFLPPSSIGASAIAFGTGPLNATTYGLVVNATGAFAGSPINTTAVTLGLDAGLSVARALVWQTAGSARARIVSSGAEAAPTPLTTSAATAASNATLSFSGGTTGVSVGNYVNGTGIPTGTTVLTVAATSIVLSANATGSGVASGATVNFMAMTGMNLVLQTYDDVGTVLSNVLTLTRATGLISLSNGFSVSGATTLTNVAISTSATAPTMASTDSTTHVATTAFVKSLGYLTANQNITLSGAAISTTSGSTALTVTPVSLLAGGTFTFSTVVVDQYGRVTSASSGTPAGGGLTSITLNGPDIVPTSGAGTVGITLQTITGLAATGTYSSVAVNSKGQVTAGSNPGYLTAAVASVAAGAGLSGGTITSSGTISLPTTGPGVSSYSFASITVDAYGRITAAASGSPPGGLTSITLNGPDIVPTSGAGTVGVTLQTIAGLAATGTYSSVAVNSKGQVTAGSNPGFLTGNQTITLSGPTLVTATGTTSLSVTAATSGVVVGTYSYPSLVVDSYGRVTSISSNAIAASGVSQVVAGAGLSGGTITTSGTIGLPTTGPGVASYSFASITLDAYGRVTAAASGSPPGIGSSVSLATLSVSGSAQVPTLGSAADSSGNAASTAWTQANFLAFANPNPILTSGVFTIATTDTATNAAFVLNGPAGTYRSVEFQSNSLARWGYVIDAGAETGGNAGSDFTLSAYDDDGNWLNTAMYVERATGFAQIPSLWASSVAQGPTVAASDNSINLATTAFVKSLPHATSFQIVGKPAAAQVNIFPVPWSCTVASLLVGVNVYCVTAPVANATFTVNRIAAGTTTTVSIGSIVIHSTSHNSITLAGAGATFSPGDVLSLASPGTADTSMANVGITIPLTLL